jgi:hypothetical protein
MYTNLRTLYTALCYGRSGLLCEGCALTHRVMVFYGSYRSDRRGIRLADYLVRGLRSRGEDVEFIDAKAVGLPMLDRMQRSDLPTHSCS